MEVGRCWREGVGLGAGREREVESTELKVEGEDVI